MATIYDLFTGKILAIDPVSNDNPSHKAYKDVAERIRARFGDTLPKHFERCLNKAQAKPYMHGDVHNVAYRKQVRLFNKPMPIPCEVTAKSCLKRNGRYLLGSQCLEGIDEAFPWMDRKYQVTLSFLRSLPDKAKLTIMTRSDLVACEEYISELRRLDCIVMILIPQGVLEETLRQIEPGAPNGLRRIEAHRKLVDNGIDSHVRYHELPAKKRKAG